MKRKVLLALSLLSLTTLAGAGTDDAGTKGTSAATMPIESTVFDVAACDRKKLSWDYIAAARPSAKEPRSGSVVIAARASTSGFIKSAIRR